MDVIGFLKAKKDTRQATETFRVREFVVTIEADSQYPQHISMQVTQDRCDLLDQFNEGDQLKVNFNLRGREWTAPDGDIRYFNSIDAWRIEKIADTPSGQNDTGLEGMPTTTATSSNDDDDDDLPF
jgi:hypothetical protein